MFVLVPWYAVPIMLVRKNSVLKAGEPTPNQVSEKNGGERRGGGVEERRSGGAEGELFDTFVK